MRLLHVALLVPEYQPALDFYCGVLGFELLEDRPVPEQGKRWLLIRPPGGGASFVLARAVGERQQAAIGNQAGGRVGFFLETDDFAASHARLLAAGVEFVRPPVQAPYGQVAVFADPFGNHWDLIELSAEYRALYHRP